MLGAGFHAVPEGMLATVVTHLEISTPPQTAEAAFPDGLVLRRHRGPDPLWYRDLFRSIGADWLWVSRLKLSDAALAEILTAPEVELWSLQRDGTDLAICELDFRAAPKAELAFFGLDARLQGQGLARPLMTHAIMRAFARPIGALTVHTCTLDHPAALPFYRRCGFRPVRQEVELMPDPRLDGLLPESAAPHVPLIRPAI